jgi:hypothetical protein
LGSRWVCWKTFLCYRDSGLAVTLLIHTVCILLEFVWRRLHGWTCRWLNLRCTESNLALLSLLMLRYILGRRSPLLCLPCVLRLLSCLLWHCCRDLHRWLDHLSGCTL